MTIARTDIDFNIRSYVKINLNGKKKEIANRLKSYASDWISYLAKTCQYVITLT